MNYYLTHPTTVDTHEGLARWRLLEEYVECTMRETREALDWLVERGFLREIPRRGGQPVFMMNTDRRQEAERFLADAQQDIRHGGR